MRKELGFCPFKHWIQITLRAKSEKSAQETAGQVYNQLNKTVSKNCLVPAKLSGFIIPVFIYFAFGFWTK